MTLTPSASPGHTDAWPMCQTASPASSSVAVGERCSPLVDVAPGAVAPFYPSPSPPPRGSRACASPSTSAPPDLIASESTESYRMSSEDCDSTQGADVACQSSKRSMSGTALHPVPPAALPLCLQSSGAWGRRAFRPWTGRCDRRAAARNTRRRSHSHRPNSRASLPFCPLSTCTFIPRLQRTRGTRFVRTSSVHRRCTRRSGAS